MQTIIKAAILSSALSLSTIALALGGDALALHVGDAIHGRDGSAMGSFVALFAADGAAAYTPEGLPVPFGPGDPNQVFGHSGEGRIFTVDSSGNYSALDYTLTSFAPVPLPSAIWLVLSGLGGVYVAGRHRVRARGSHVQ